MTRNTFFQPNPKFVCSRSILGAFYELVPGGARRFGSIAGAIIAVICMSIGLAGTSADAQVTGLGVISGVVTDSSGSAIVMAQMTVTNISTNVSQMSVTNSTGYFEVDSLKA